MIFFFFQCKFAPKKSNLLSPQTIIFFLAIELSKSLFLFSTGIDSKKYESSRSEKLCSDKSHQNIPPDSINYQVSERPNLQYYSSIKPPSIKKLSNASNAYFFLNKLIKSVSESNIFPLKLSKKSRIQKKTLASWVSNTNSMLPINKKENKKST